MPERRIVFAAPGSGSGKTTVTCGVLQALCDRGMRVFSFKCGPDYIDPMFQERVIGVPSGTLDLFFQDPGTMKRLFKKHAADAEIAVVEGVMGYYDGQGAATDEASTYQVAKTLEAPVVLIADARGQSLSALATLEGFMRFRPDSNIRGVIFNRMSESVFRALKPEVEKLGVIPLGYLPKADDLMIESRHLGLVTPDGIADLSGKLRKLADLLSRTVDLDALVRLSEEAPELTAPPAPAREKAPAVRIACARDEAFCFWYRDNLELLRELGAETVFFSPIRDKTLPEGVKGLILPGGYPELYAKELADNREMRSAVFEAVRSGMPCLAECGGFLYLHRELEDMDGNFLPMAGVLDARARRTNRLGRFGYVTLSAQEDKGLFKAGETVRAHEFHYYESEDCGTDLHAVKPAGNRNWDCCHVTETLFAGFPHLYYESDPGLVLRFLRKAAGEE